ncbi:IK cytokine [Microdochium nivale]|nr:IK cytokine [Microdochium nivale]
MNNDQFKRLVAANSPNTPADGIKPVSGASATPSSLGSRQRSSIPMTPRSVAGFGKSDFARQLAERNRSDNDKTHGKKSKSYDPKGVKLAAGYTDRAQARNTTDSLGDDNREQRMRALEESFRKEEISEQTFDKLRAQIAGGDLSSTHLVKGLDFDLLERVRRGEDVWDAPDKEEVAEPTPGEDVDDAFEELEVSAVSAVARETAAKRGQLATARPGGKRTRDQLLAEMKAAREAKAKENALSTKFKKIGAKTPGSRIERDSLGREVLIMVDEDGNEKRKIRKVQKATADKAVDKARPKDMALPDKNATPLGMEVPEYYQQKLAEAKAKEEEDDDDDIFAGVGDNYDPLADLGSESDDDDKNDPEEKPVNQSCEVQKGTMGPPPAPVAAASRNYFKDSKTALVSEEKLTAPSMSDPAIQAALKKAAALNPMRVAADDEDEDEARAKQERLRKMVENDDRDAADMDMGFGTSRLEDEAEFDETKVKLSKWSAAGANDNDDEDGRGGGGGTKRKRGPKKRKGDGNSAADVMRLVEKRRTEQ